MVNQVIMAIETFQWSAMSADMNQIEHVWHLIGRKVNQRNPQCQNIVELTNTAAITSREASSPSLWNEWAPVRVLA